MGNGLTTLVQNIIYHRWGREHPFWNDILFSEKQHISLFRTVTVNEHTVQNKDSEVFTNRYPANIHKIWLHRAKTHTK